MNGRILFITRNYPPKLGGLERYSFSLIREFAENGDVSKITLSKSNVHLFWFLPYALIRALYETRRYPVQAIHLCDAMLAPIGCILKFFTHLPVSATIHGLDIAYENLAYQTLIPRCAARLDRIVCVSRATRDACVARKIPPGRCVVIPNGIHPEDFLPEQPGKKLRSHLSRLAGVCLDGKTVLVTVGRLVRRKGTGWFVENVMPRLGNGYHYLIAGEGPERFRIEAALRRAKLTDRVSLLGQVSDRERNLILNAADCFIMPNISVPGDIEGFGIAIIEAGASGLPVVASDLQGIKDAVIEGKSGYLVPERDTHAFIEKIACAKPDRSKIRSVVAESFGWKQLYARYRQVFATLQRNQKENHPG